MNDLCRYLGIDYPIIQGGMGNISNAPLTAAISNAGGLGTIGVGTMELEEVEALIKATQNKTGKPFAVNIPINVSPYTKDIIHLLVKYEVEVVSLSAGNPAPYIEFLHDHHIKVMTVVGTVRQAVKAYKSGVDIIVAEGYEAAGINATQESTTMTLLPQIVDQVDVPVVAAGGIGDGRGLAAVLALGASGVQMGTRFIATKEAPFHNHYKQALLEANDHQTTIVGREVGRVRRIMNTPYAEKLKQLEQSGADVDNFSELTSEHYHKIGALEGKLEEGFINAGQISGIVKDIPTVQQLLNSMLEELRGSIITLEQYQLPIK
ncbi:NAD(P)H-dependent flavin oxidoreductase [Pontibacillus salicampi]|uniref:Probable nitronate monooxygenase n=1 Tax=Pontibacillus salicampi TaxID=1449801 RepID=A0ABV6LKA1_9BACI